jgi:glutamine cyclotransferase
MRFDRCQQLRRVTPWLLALVAVASIVSCQTPTATDQSVGTIPAASPPVSATPRVMATEPSPVPTVSPPDTGVGETITAEAIPQAGADPVTAPLLAPVALTEALTVDAIPVYTYRIVNVFPHDRSAFTQGLIFEDGVMYEGTGLWGQSTLRRVDLESGDVLELYSLSPEYFGEGITIWADRIIQLTWKARVGFVYDKDSFDLLGSFDYPTQGWGITHDGEKLIMSDGTSRLRFWDPETFEETGQVQVYDSEGPVTRLNELEYVEGAVYANVWQTDRVAIIDPGTGRVNGWIDLEGLLGPEDYGEPVDVLNGIAYDAASERLFVTGKLWPKLFEIELVLPQ